MKSDRELLKDALRNIKFLRSCLEELEASYSDRLEDSGKERLDSWTDVCDVADSSEVHTNIRMLCNDLRRRINQL